MKNIISLFIILLFSGCAVMEKAGRVLDGSAFTEKQIALYRSNADLYRYHEHTGNDAYIEISIVQNKNNEQSIVITFNNYPMLKIRGSYPLENTEIQTTSLEYFGSYTHGWNEYSMAMLGTGKLSLEPGGANFVITENFEQVEITGGRIHRYDTRITGSEAVTALRNRHERMLALVEWMSSLEDAPKRLSIKEFEIYWKPILLPEMVSKGKRPLNWRLNTDTFQRAESISWNKGYTERVFPEELHPIRNSGTLLRDWEEALPWLYMEYEWENIVELLKEEISLNKIK
ncbi:MAG: hypothetical protein LBU88_03500 [Treponema sp.]|nr:hypothetical protein [Treponema sp.]